jgi:hypothetical protein
MVLTPAATTKATKSVRVVRRSAASEASPCALRPRAATAPTPTANSSAAHRAILVYGRKSEKTPIVTYQNVPMRRSVRREE